MITITRNLGICRFTGHPNCLFLLLKLLSNLSLLLCGSELKQSCFSFTWLGAYSERWGPARSLTLQSCLCDAHPCLFLAVYLVCLISSLGHLSPAHSVLPCTACMPAGSQTVTSREDRRHILCIGKKYYCKGLNSQKKQFRENLFSPCSQGAKNENTILRMNTIFWIHSC